ncbi:Aste57867_14815 [Aphanomyces stellatus]|uniref:Aste57867_14815 protein n=1 Tax=Aphanomyces stellatus TaxID=120398 RepID=A0A485L2H6_9STRA|nr:hypothetical protein As57867_014759 [Aphanomyces stellatus]VFT91633.1 Aste57867_14815 [Aphanomyces stellatus]
MPTMMRTFMSQPSLSADWSGEYEEKSAQWFELFLDLIMVAACSNVTEKLKEDLSFHGFLYFVLLTTAYTMTWMLFTNFHARFNEKSLLHYAYLYLLLSGLGGMVLAGEPGAAFTIGMLLARVSILFMYITIYVLLPKVRPNVFTDISVVAMSSLTLVISLALPESWTMPSYILAMTFESAGRLVVGQLRTQAVIPMEIHRIPLNIDHFNERVGCLVMVSLGEAVVSAIINFDKPELLTTRFFFMMQLALLVLFSTAMFYFTIQPVRDFHALRRSAVTGIVFAWLHYLLVPTLLSIGVGLKFTTAAVLVGVPLSSADVWLLFGGIAATLLVMLGLRLCHFGGRQPAPTDPELAKRIKYAWWVVVGVSPIFPLVCAAALVASSPDDSIDPIHALVLAAVFNLVWILIETAMMNRLVEMGQDLPGAPQKGESVHLLHN